MRKKGIKNKNYSPEFKISVIAETANYRFTLRNWERIYLEEGEIGFMEEKRGRKSKSYH